MIARVCVGFIETRPCIVRVYKRGSPDTMAVCPHSVSVPDDIYGMDHRCWTAPRVRYVFCVSVSISASVDWRVGESGTMGMMALGVSGIRIYALLDERTVLIRDDISLYDKSLAYIYHALAKNHHNVIIQTIYI